MVITIRTEQFLTDSFSSMKKQQNEFNRETMNTFPAFQYECRQLVVIVFSLHLKFFSQLTTKILFGQVESNFTVGKHLLCKRDLSNERKPKPNPTQGKFLMGNHLTQASVTLTKVKTNKFNKENNYSQAPTTSQVLQGPLCKHDSVRHDSFR